MKFFEEIENRTLILRKYKSDTITSKYDALRRLIRVKEIDGIVVNVIRFDDLGRSTDEGSESTMFSDDASYEEMENELSVRSIDSISLTVNYKDTLAVIGIDLNKKYTYITISKKRKDLLEELETKLEIV